MFCFNSCSGGGAGGWEGVTMTCRNQRTICGFTIWILGNKIMLLGLTARPYLLDHLVDPCCGSYLQMRQRET